MRISDWSSDVCSSDLRAEIQLPHERRIKDGAGHQRDEEEEAHQAQEQHAGQSQEHVGVKLEQEVHHAFLTLPARRLPGGAVEDVDGHLRGLRSEEHTSELQSLMRISYAVFCLKKNT